ncbi:MAG TPA: DUF2235 domain-containing protein, partial [Flavisolibacter sp.]|nr:DUF2235 domain-containing protein [Flavisolibacter sp.]
MGKNIVVLSDGTGQLGGKKHNTNVYKLFNLLEDRTPNQIAFYDPGLGTDWKKITGNIGGRGFSKNLLDCYRFIFQNFEAGDNIYLFGFSRGAATVRSLSGFIHLFGILPKCREDLIREAYRIYKIKDADERKKKAAALVEKNSTMWCKIKFLGVWDTVAALGLPVRWASYFLDRFLPHRFHNFQLSDSVEYARHALSIDDERKTFHPTLWDRLSPGEPPERLKQVWFSGVHTDVGGGYKEEELSNITLCWMIQEATGKGLRLYEKGSVYERFKACRCDPNGMMHNEQIGFPGKLFRRLQRTWNIETNGEPSVHASVLK